MDTCETFVPLPNGSWYWKVTSLSYYNYNEVIAFGISESISDVFREIDKVKGDNCASL